MLPPGVRSSLQLTSTLSVSDAGASAFSVKSTTVAKRGLLCVGRGIEATGTLSSSIKKVERYGCDGAMLHCTARHLRVECHAQPKRLEGACHSSFAISRRESTMPMRTGRSATPALGFGPFTRERAQAALTGKEPDDAV